jgi:RNA polymerase sigma-70 factor (ECF subfamily)
MDLKAQWMDHEENESLLQRPRSGDLDALDDLLERHKVPIYNRSLRILGNEQDAEDALQDAFFLVLRHFDQFEGRSKFSTWLTRITSNAALMFRRRRSAHPEDSLDHRLSEDEGMTPIGITDLHPDPEQLCSCSEMASLVNELFKQLSEPLQMAFQRRHIDELSCLEAGRSLGIS